MGKIRRRRRPAKAPLEVVGVKDAEEVAVGKMWRPRPPAKAPLKAVGAKDAERVAVISVDREVEAPVLESPVVAAARGWEKGPLEDGTAVCLMVSLDAAPVIAMTRQEAVGVKNAAGVAVGKMWRPRPPAKAPLKAVGVKDTKGVAVITRDGVKASGLGAPTVGGGEKGPLEDGIAMCRMDALAKAPVITTTRQEVVGVQHARGVAVEKMWRRGQPAKAPLKAVGVEDTEGVAVITRDGVKASGLGAPLVGGEEKGPLADGIAMCRTDALAEAPVIATTRQEAVGVKDVRGVAVGKMWRPRPPAKAPLKAVGVKDTKGVAVITRDGVKASGLGAPMVGGGEKGPLEDGIAMCRMDPLAKAPVITTTRQEVVGVKYARGVAVEKMWRRGQPAKAPLKAVGVNDTEGVAVITRDGVKASGLGAPLVGAEEKGPLADGIAICRTDALAEAPVIATTRQEAVGVKDVRGVAVGKMWQRRQPGKAPLKADGVKDAEGVLGAPVVVVAEGGEKGPVEEGIVVCRVDNLDGAPVTTTTQHEVVGVKDTEEDAVGKMWRPRRPKKAPLEAVRVKDAKAVAVITHVGEAEPLVLGVPVVAAAGGEEKGSLEDGIVVCPMDALVGARVIATDEKEEVSVQRDSVFPAIDQKVDAPVVEGMQAITVKGNGKEEKDKDKERIKWLKHYSTAQNILIIGDGDFSFSLALATTFGSGGNLVATSLDSYGALTIKYGKAESNVRELKRLGATVLHGVDAKTMKLHSYLVMRRFDRIVFNFPHAGFKGKENQLHVINAHKQLVHGFFANARELLRPYGEIHLSHKKGLPYDAWGIETLAYESCLIMVRKVDFSKADYPGYNQKRGDGPTCDESFPLGRCCTFMLCVGDVEKLKQAHGNRVGSTSSCLCDRKFYPGISATDMMWPFDLHPAWPQPHFPPVHMQIAFDPCPFRVAEMEDPFNFYGTSFHHQAMVQEGPPIEPPWTPQEHQSLQREYEIHRQLSLSLEAHYMESVERQAMLEMLSHVYSRH